MADNNAPKAMTKSAVYQEIVESTGLTKKQVGEVFDALSKLLKRELGKKGPGMFTLPGLAKLKLVRKPATKARQGVNPFTKQPQMFKAKPARKIVRARPVKAALAGITARLAGYGVTGITDATPNLTVEDVATQPNRCHPQAAANRMLSSSDWSAARTCVRAPSPGSRIAD